MPAGILLAVLAGGEGKRYGKPKLLARIPQGTTTLESWARRFAECEGRGWRPVLVFSPQTLPLAWNHGVPGRLEALVHRGRGPLDAALAVSTLYRPSVLLIGLVDQPGPPCSLLEVLAVEAYSIRGAAIPWCGTPYYTPLAVYKPWAATNTIIGWLRGERTRLTDLVRLWGRISLVPHGRGVAGDLASFNRPGEEELLGDATPCPRGSPRVVALKGGLESVLDRRYEGRWEESRVLLAEEVRTYESVGLGLLARHAREDLAGGGWLG